MKQRIGIFGGSFDPVHLGHLILAEMFRESMRLDRVHFLLAKISPFKTETLPTSDAQRQEMLRLAIGSNPAFVLDDRELRRGGVSYTIDSIRELQREVADAHWYMLVGEDSLEGFDRWREPEEILDRVQLVVAARGGFDQASWESLERVATEDQLARIRSHRVDAPQIEIASRDLRRRVREGRSIRYLVPAAVEAYIQAQRLWRAELD